MQINIKILSNKEFDSLSEEFTRGADISDSLGFADVKRNKIYVRDMGVPELNRFLLTHEIDHLFEDEVSDADPEVDGIRHKKFRQAVGNIGAAAAPILGGLFAAPTGGLSIAQGAGIGGLLGGAAKGGIGGKKRSLSGAVKGAAIGGPAAFGASKLTGGFGIPSTGNFASRLAAGAKSGFGIPGALKGAGSALAGAFGIPSAQAATASPATGSPGSISGLNNALQNPRFLNPTQLSQQNAGRFTGDSGTNVLSKFNTGLLGAGLLGAGLLKPFPKVPELPESVENLRNRATTPGPLGALGQERLTGLLNEQFDPLGEPEIQALTRQLDEDEEDAIEAVRDLYRNVRPGAQNDSAKAKDIADVRERFGQLRADAVANRTRDLQTQFDQQRLQQILASQGFSQQEIQNLAQIAQLDVDSVAAQLNLDVRQAQLFKDIFTQLGTSLLFPQEPSAPLVAFNV